METSPEVQVEETQPNEPVEAAPEPQPASTHPWDADLRAALEGAEDPVAAASEFIAGNVQPRVTELEQTIAATPGEALELWEDLSNDPSGTVAAILDAMYGEGAADKFKAAMDEVVEDTTPPDQPTEVPLDPKVQALIEKEEQREADELFDQLYNDVKAQEEFKDLPEHIFAEKLMSTDGDVGEALNRIRADREHYKKEFGIDDEETTMVEAPPTIGSDTQTPTQPDPPKEYKSFDQLDEALDDFTNEIKPSPPTPVGTV